MNNKDILRIALEQSAIDANCHPNDFCLDKNIVVVSNQNANARKYLELPFYCDLISYGNNIVASADESIAGVVLQYINKFAAEHCFETPNLYVLNEMLQNDMQICFMAEYFLPDVEILKPLSCSYKTKILTQKDFVNLYTPLWNNALCEKRKDLDVLAIGAYDGDTLIGLAGCSADCDTMWQIGIDVLPAYRKLGIASALTSTLAVETLKLGKVPFYCCAWSNIRSAKNAIKSGFRPAWVELTAKSKTFIYDINQQSNFSYV